MTSKLAQMQARFQQKQMQEKEEKLLKLYENQQQRAFEKVGRSSAGSDGSSTASVGSNNGGGKVRQMFEERRQKAGIDKSYPLEPIKNNKSSNNTIRGGSITNRTTNTLSMRSTTTNKTMMSQVKNGAHKTMIVNQKESFQKLNNNNFPNNGSNNKQHNNNLVEIMNNHNIKDAEEFQDEEDMPRIGFNDQEKPKLYMTGKLANVGGKLPSQRFIEGQAANKANQNIISQRTASNTVNKSEAKIVPKKPVAVKSSTTPPRKNSISSTTVSSPSNKNPASSAKAEVNKMSSKQVKVSSGRAPASNKPSAKQTAKSPVVRDDLAECRFCGRRFATDRLGVHEDICGKTGKKKRKAYDATRHRVTGTELEGYVMRGGKKVQSNKKGKSSGDAIITNKINNEEKISAKHTSAKAGTWRKTHEEFIAAIRAAKQAQAYVAKGGKLSDLPPPPPSSNPDYVQCPHCGRRFNESAAARHIPKCASYDFNKPANKGRPAGKR